MQTGSSLTQVVGGTGTFADLLIGTTFPGFQTVELCTHVANNCSGGAQSQAIGEGNFDNFSLTLAFASPSTTTPPSFTIDGPVIRFKGDLGSFTGSGCQSNDPNCTPGIIPEPSTILLFGSGLAGLGLWRWKTKK